MIRKKGKYGIDSLYGTLCGKNEVEHWPSPEEIKNIWE
jgi:hypothetical protein